MGNWISNEKTEEQHFKFILLNEFSIGSDKIEIDRWDPIEIEFRLDLYEKISSERKEKILEKIQFLDKNKKKMNMDQIDYILFYVGNSLFICIDIKNPDFFYKKRCYTTNI